MPIQKPATQKAAALGALCLAATLITLISGAALARPSWAEPRQPRRRRSLHETKALVDGVLQQLAGWSGLALAHNLSSSPSQEHVQAVYRQQLTALLGRPGLVWARAGAAQRFCRCFSGPSQPSAGVVALVVDQPMSAEQRRSILQARCVVRVGPLSTRQPGEQTDLWMVGVHMEELAREFSNEGEQAMEVGAQAQGIVLAGRLNDPPHRASPGQQEQGSPDLAQLEAAWGEALRSSGIPPLVGYNESQWRERLLPLETGAHLELWRAVLRALGFEAQGEAQPSIGLTGLLAVLECLPLDGSVDVYGFGWAGTAAGQEGDGAERLQQPKQQQQQQALEALEGSLAQAMAQLYAGRVRLHAPRCAGDGPCDAR